MKPDLFIQGKQTTLYLTNGIKISGVIHLPPFFPYFSSWIKIVSTKSTIIVNIDEVISIQFYND